MAAAAVSAVVLCAPRWAAAQALSEVDIYYGVGNFSHLQHEFTLKEASELGRRGGDVTSVAGYAGGIKTGEFDKVCYSFISGADHVALGHAEVVQVSLPPDEKSVSDFTSLWLDEVAKRKRSEQGTQYRAVVGLRGGVRSPWFPIIKQLSEGRVRLEPAKGDEPDNLEQGLAYVYDAKSFPFRVAEEKRQFSDDPPERYESDYRALREKMLSIGAINASGCA